VQRRLQFFARVEVVVLQHLLEPAVETLDNTVGLGVLRRRETVLNAQVTAQSIELMLTGGGALLKWSGKTGQRAKMYPTLKTGYTNGEETQLFRQV
jgi:hypothetical protein